MKKSSQCLLAAAVFFLGVTRIVKGAELFDVPSGMMVRSLAGWDNEDSLDIQVAGKRETVATRDDGVAEHLFSPLELCEEAAYRVGAGPWHPLEDYCAPPHGESTSFLVIADSQQYHEEHRKTGQLIARLKHENPDVQFVLNAGDLVHFGLESEWRKYRAISTETYSGDIPIIPALGNHEFYLDFSLANWKTLYATPETEKHYYALEFAHFALVVLNSNVEWLLPKQKREQTAWLEAILKAHYGKKPVLVTFHHPGFTSGNGPWLIPFPPHHVKTQWQPLFEKYKVKLVMNGHEHIYERLNVNGVQHLLVGPAGGSLSKPGKTSPYSQFLMPNFRSVSLVTVGSGGGTRIRSYSVETGAIVDDFSY